MAFTRKEKSLDEVLKTWAIRYEDGKLLPQTDFSVSPATLSDMAFIMENLDYKSSESALREYVISPMLLEAWKRYAAEFLIWVERPIKFGKELAGVPDYVISRRSPMGKIFFEHPHIAIVEAKKDDFIGGWAQCVLGMITAQKINGTPAEPIFGIVTNGDVWEFAQLENATFTRFSNSFLTSRADDLHNALCTVFERSREKNNSMICPQAVDNQ